VVQGRQQLQLLLSRRHVADVAAEDLGEPCPTAIQLGDGIGGVPVAAAEPTGVR
jgi:hypothetical protein